MTFTDVALLTSSALYAGFQWTIRVLVYPQFAQVPADAFAAYERVHQRLVSYAVGPLFALFGVSAAAAVLVRPGVASIVAAACYAAILVITWLGAVPLHGRLSDGFDAASHRRLLRVDTLRLVLALGAVAAAVVLVTTG